MANGWLTDTLILLPLGGAIFIALAPLPRLAAGLVALAVSLVEIAFWGGALTAFDYGSGASSVQLQDTTTWFGDLGISYHVGFTGFALWLVGLASIIVLGISQGSFDMTAPTAFGGSDWIFLGFVAAFVVKAPIFPFHGWLPDAYREAPAEVAGVLSGVVSKAAAYGFLYIAILH